MRVDARCVLIDEMANGYHKRGR